MSGCGGGSGGGSGDPSPDSNTPITQLQERLAPGTWNCNGSGSDFMIEYSSATTGIAAGDAFTWEATSADSYNITFPASGADPEEAFSVSSISFAAPRGLNDQFNAVDSRDNSTLTCNGSEWGILQAVEGNAGDASSPEIVSTPNGGAIAVWSQTDGTRNNIWANRFNASTGWGTAEKIESEDLGDAFFPKIAADSSGNAIVVWSQNDGSRDNIRANRFDVTSASWGTAEVLESDGNDSLNPNVAMNASGEAIVTWIRRDGGPGQAFARRYLPGTGAGTGWLAQEPIENQADGVDVVEVGIDADGNSLAVWQQADGVAQSIWANYHNGEGWQGEAVIEADSGAAGPPVLAMNAAGEAIAIWHQTISTVISTSQQIRFNKFSSFVWGAGGIAVDIQSTDDVTFPEISLNAAGQALAAWKQTDATTSKQTTMTSRYDGTFWQTTPDAVSTASDSINIDSVVLDGSGNGRVFYRASNGLAEDFLEVKFVSGSSPGDARYFAARSFGSPRAVIASDDNAMVIGSSSIDGVTNIVFSVTDL